MGERTPLYASPLFILAPFVSTTIYREEVGGEDLVTFSADDALTVDLTSATVVMLYLVEWSTAKLQPIIRSQVKLERASFPIVLV